MLNIYNAHFTGSSLWDFQSVNVNQLLNSWNVNLRIICGVPIDTHKYVIERIVDCKHAKHKIFSRYVKFIHSLGQSKKSILRNLFNLIHKDMISVTGANLRHIAIETNKDFIPGITKRIDLTDYMVYQLPEGEEWRIPFLLSLISK